MQNTPYVRKEYWTMHVEQLGYFRSHAMLWGRNSEDPFYKWGDRDEMFFNSVEGAVSYAKSCGYDVEVIYPHERYHQQKAYADNFNFVKEGIEDVEDEQEINLEMLTRLI
jgi:hypothetical protein